MYASYDAGFDVETSYTGGVRRSARYIDMDDSGARNWSEYTNTYNANGQITLQAGTYDDGNRWESRYVNGVRGVFQIFDDADLYAYETRSIYYGADGVTRAREDQILDAGGLLVRQYEAGQNIAGGVGNDTFYGADGADTFVFNGNGGHDVIRNFQNGVDRLNIEAFGFQNFAQVQAIAQAITSTRIRLNFSATASLEIEGLALADLGIPDFTQLFGGGGGGGTGGVGGGGGGGGGPGDPLAPPGL